MKGVFVLAVVGNEQILPERLGVNILCGWHF